MIAGDDDNMLENILESVKDTACRPELKGDGGRVLEVVKAAEGIGVDEVAGDDEGGHAQRHCGLAHVLECGGRMPGYV